jgi:hypothetical protein
LVQADRVIAFGPPKEAALYFEQVLPLDLSMGWFGALGIDFESGHLADATQLGIPFDNARFDEEVVKSLLPGVDDPLRLYANQLAVTSALPITILLSALSKFKQADFDSDETGAMRSMFEFAGLDIDTILDRIRDDTLDIGDVTSRVIPRVKWFLEKSGFIGSPTWLSAALNDPQANNNSNANTQLECAVAIRNLKLVDVRNVPWTQIVEFRKDTTSLSRLRRLRTFFSENYAGKEEAYVKDKLLSSIEDYEATTKVWGFDTAHKTLSVAVSNQNVIASSVATLAPAVAGMPLSVAAGAGAIITLGKCALEFSKIFVDRRREMLTSPMSYLSKLRKLGGK